jgi:cyclohexa-1,5-dienecarbonyl-CoA hydratase
MIKAELDERVLKLSLDLPPVNVLDTANLEELAQTLAALDDSVSAVLLSGAGKCFSAGASVEEHQPEQARRMLDALSAACLALANAPVPTVALVHGSCLGGGFELAMFCDYVVADPEATFGVPEIQLAFYPPLACYQLAWLCGRQNAASVIFSGRSFGAERARELGVVQDILAVDEWDKVARSFNRLSRPVVRLAKQAFLLGSGRPDAERVAELNGLFMERLYQHQDVHEGIASFLEKRKPTWTHS